ncbi:MAG TPA: MBL fold metallo-hydrolase [Candidatus Sulfotelmatobacter sp.]|nr:MBL fold metallo-hydrolase [Candidatus Sulfotelmatobacter sp.]
MPSPPSHHTARGFRNPPGSPERRHDAAAYWRFVRRRILQRQVLPAVPSGHVLPAAEAADGLARHAGAPASLTWLGHAAFLLRLGGKNVLLDPYLGDFASPIGGLGPRRFVPAAIPPERLPPIDVLIVSHNHYDHLCAATLRVLPGKDRMQVIVPLGLARFFRRRGFAKVVELDWRQGFAVDGLHVTALPAVHWSKRTPFNRNRTLWASFALKTERHRVWFAGDTGYGPIFGDLGRDYGPFDLALVPIGAYAPRDIMAAHHATPEEAVRIGRDMRADRLVAMHWGTIVLTDEPPFEPPERFRAAAAAAGYAPDQAWLMRIGETRPLAPRWPANE